MGYFDFYQGKLFVIDGPDGIGKSTQLNLLKEYFDHHGVPYESMHFPTHGEGYYGCLVDEYLGGKFGSFNEVDPTHSAFLYAMNRKENSKKIKSWLDSGKAVILDRYVSSAMAHQAAGYKTKEERSDFYTWLFSLEFDTNKIPKPDKVIIFESDLDTILLSVKERGRSDIHEKDSDHLRKALNVYREIALKFNYDLIKVDYNGSFRSRESIHSDVLNAIKAIPRERTMENEML
jgi:dTMP kinase